jgi:RIO kinase 1
VLDDQGKEARGRRERVALAKKTRFGQDLRHLTWLTSEVETLRLLHAAGADVPRVFAHNDNAILMEYLGELAQPAPTLQEVRLPQEEARPLFDRLLHNVELMMAHGKVHGDLSAHNILYWAGTVKIIDFPQAVSPFQNPHAQALLARDVERVCQYFARYGIVADAPRITADLWNRYVLAENELSADG